MDVFIPGNKVGKGSDIRDVHYLAKQIDKCTNQGAVGPHIIQPSETRLAVGTVAVHWKGGESSWEQLRDILRELTGGLLASYNDGNSLDQRDTKLQCVDVDKVGVRWRQLEVGPDLVTPLDSEPKVTVEGEGTATDVAGVAPGVEVDITWNHLRNFDFPLDERVVRETPYYCDQCSTSGKWQGEFCVGLPKEISDASGDDGLDPVVQVAWKFRLDLKFETLTFVSVH